jgi:predicted Zn-ribbon and HTH transcriptional regulator
MNYRTRPSPVRCPRCRGIGFFGPPPMTWDNRCPSCKGAGVISGRFYAAMLDAKKLAHSALRKAASR